MMLDKQIEALERQRDKLRAEDHKLERIAQENEWKRENADAIKFCKKIAGKPFTFGPNVIKHHYWKPFDDEDAIEYDYVSVYYPLYIDYVDKYHVHMCCRHLDSDDHTARLTNTKSLDLPVSYLDGTYKPSENESYYGAIHILTDAELKIAFDFWMQKATEMFANDFTTKSNRPWECSFDPERLDRYRRAFNKPKESNDTDKTEEETEEEKFNKEREAILSARKAYYKLVDNSEYGSILRAETDRTER